MVETVGKRLGEARLARGLTIDEAAHATKMRPDKILALENDDFSRFGNNAYAKGFLILYGRFLRVDVAEQVRALETPSDIRLSEYQYLSNASPRPTERASRPRKSRKPSFAPLIAFALLLIVGAFGFYFYITAQRIGSLDRKSSAAEAPRPTQPLPTAEPGAASPPAAATSGPAVGVAPPPVAIQPAPTTGEARPIIPAVPVGTPAQPAGAPPASNPSPTASANSLNGFEVRRAEAVPASRVPAPPAPAAVTGGVNEVVVEALRKTWVRICKDDPNSPPIFMDYLYPNAAPLKLRGARFFIEARDPTGVQIRKNGAPMAYQPPGILVQ
jgi:cytoskeletal protein RodZ